MRQSHVSYSFSFIQCEDSPHSALELDPHSIYLLIAGCLDKLKTLHAHVQRPGKGGPPFGHFIFRRATKKLLFTVIYRLFERKGFSLCEVSY